MPDLTVVSAKFIPPPINTTDECFVNYNLQYLTWVWVVGNCSAKEKLLAIGRISLLRDIV